MENPASDKLDDTAPPVATNAGPVARNRNRPLLILFGVLGAAFAIFVGVMARSTAAPEASAASTSPSRIADVARVVNEAPAASRWTSGGRWVSDRKSVAFELKSVNRVNVWMGQVQPLLVVRCTANRTETFVYTETAARIEPGKEDRAVRVRLDDEPYVDDRWLDSAEHKGLFAPNGETFTHRLLNATTLRFQFTPHNAETAEVQFQVAGLRELIAPVQKRCGWNR